MAIIATSLFSFAFLSFPVSASNGAFSITVSEETFFESDDTSVNRLEDNQKYNLGTSDSPLTIASELKLLKPIRKVVGESTKSTAKSYTVTSTNEPTLLTTLGTYTNTYTINVSGTPTTYKIAYYDNVASSMPNDEGSVSGSTSINLSNTAPTRTGFSFYGWCDQPTTKDGEYDVCANGHSYQPGTSYTLDATGTTNNVKLYAIWGEERLEPQPSTAGCINYFANASDAVGTMGCQSKDDSDNDISDGASVTLLASNFSREGYGFAGWSDAYDYATNASAHFYGPQETITVPTGTTGNGLSLYAVWVESEGSIQDQSKVASVCNRLTTAPTDGTANLSSVSALTDQRDHQTYAIAKLADGKCWMIENLRLESRDTVGQNRFDSSITNASLAQGYGTSATYGNFGGLADAENANFTDSTTANSLYYSGTQSGTASIDIGTTDYPGSRMPRYNNFNTSTRASSPTGNDNNIYSYGNYYTWHAAMANTTHYSSSTATDADGKTSETVNTSLCPTGWRLPYGGSSGNGATTGGFYNLNYKINNDSNVTDSTASLKLRSFPNNFLYSGNFYTSSANYRGSNGYYWLSTAGYYGNSSYMHLKSSSVSTYSGIKYVGLSIRCTVGS